MATNESTTKFRADISELKAAMQTAQREVKLANAQFKAASSAMDDWSKTAEGLQAKLKQLNTVESAQQKQLGILEKELELTSKQYGENSSQADNLRIRIENQKAAINNTKKEIDKYTKELDDCGKETDQLGDESVDTTKDMGKLSNGFTVAKGALADLVSAGIKMAITGLKNLGKAAMEAYKEFDKGADNVIKATGATGEAAKELEENYKNVAHNVVGDMSSIGSALGEVNTRFGFTGDELEACTEQFMKFADITGTDATEAVKLVSRAMENSGMEAKDYSKLLDTLAKAGQKTGVRVDTLAESITKNGATLRQLGYTTEESVAMLAKFEKEGVNTETALAGMKKAVANWGKEGKNAKEEYKRVLSEIARTKDVAKASEIAIEAFGSKAGPELVEDIQAGKLEYQDFLKELEDSVGTVTSTYEATQDGFDKVTLAIQGAKADMGSFIKDLATEYQDDIVGFIEKAKNWLKGFIEWIVKNGDTIIDVLRIIGTVMATVFAIKKITAFAEAINGVISSISAFAKATTAAATATTAASTATGIFSKLISPGGAVVLGITAVIAVTASLISIFKEEEHEIDVLTEAQKQSIQKSQEMKTAYDEMEKSRQESMASVQNEYAYYAELLKELDSIVGASGKVKEGYEERAAFITTTLNEALGMEMEMQNGIIQNYQQERKEISQLIELRKAEAILQANEAAYTEAIQKRTEAQNTYTEARKTFNEVLKATEEQAVKVEEEYIKMAQIEKEEGVSAAAAYRREHEEVFQTYEELKNQVSVTRTALKQATEAYEGYNQTIVNYEGLSSAIIGGDSDKINAALLRTENGLKDHTQTTADQLKKQAEITEENYERLKQAYDEGDKMISEKAVADAKALAELAAKEYEESGKQTAAGYSKGIEDWSVYAEQAAHNLGYDSWEALNEELDIHSPSKKTEDSGANFAQGFINGMDSKGSTIYNKAYSLAKKAVEGLRAGQKEGSPSKITRQSGKFFTEGYIDGMGSMTRQIVKTASGIAEDAVDALGASGFLADARNAAKDMIGSVGSELALGDINGAKAGVASSGAYSNSGTSGNGRPVVNYVFNQNNNSPKPLNRTEIYRQTNNLLQFARGV